MRSGPDPIELTRELVQVESTSGSAGEARIFEIVDGLLRAAGFEVTVDAALPPRFLFARTRRSGPQLLFVCHVDTVPVDNVTAWQHAPTSGDIEGGRLYGRGASDMKSGVAAAVVALLRAGPDGPPAAVLLTTGEEVGCLGAAAAAGKIADQPVGALIVPESTDNRIALGHRGTSWLRLSVQGQAAHAGTPQLGRNALLPLAAALVDLADHGPWWGERAAIGATTVNVATMAAGSAPNIVPERATAVVDVRPARPGVVQEVVKWLAERHESIDAALDIDLPPVSTSPDNPWVRSLPAELAEPTSVGYFTDAAELQKVFASAPVVIWGPGQAELAHKRDESVAVDRIAEAVTLYTRALTDWPSAPREEM
jgi:succinyl-diaminopimelate desuccinylase